MLFRTPRRALPIATLAVLVTAAATIDTAESLAADEKVATVGLTVDYGDGAEARFKALAWRDGMTVLDALEAAAKHPHGIKLAKRGRGTSTLITEIGGLKNDASGKNWLYSVNGKVARVGAGAYELDSGDVVLWEYKEYDYN